MSTNNQNRYAGDILPNDAWTRLAEDENSVLVDVRTPEEWTYVGVPDISDLGKECFFVPWLFYPKNNINPNFVHQVLETVKPLDEDTTVLFICRSGIRSAFAAQALADMGYNKCFNVAHGFEGDHNKYKHRGRENGWKVDGLPWLQG
ncbi:MAG: rhodanese-like domain-containing protein [Magnetovibrio sp.]|nr:rhodanese-like domain-containing protein [Magnetovibrio sp.]